MGARGGRPSIVGRRAWSVQKVSFFGTPCNCFVCSLKVKRRDFLQFSCPYPFSVLKRKITVSLPEAFSAAFIGYKDFSFWYEKWGRPIKTPCTRMKLSGGEG